MQSTIGPHETLKKVNDITTPGWPRTTNDEEPGAGSAGTILVDDPAELAIPVPLAITAADRLKALYEQPGPFVSVYLATESRPGSLLENWVRTRKRLEREGATAAALDAVEQRFSAPMPEDVAGIGVLAAANGETVTDHGLEPPSYDVAVVDTLPYAGPMLEWQQRRLPHLVVTVDDDGADVVVFGLDHHTQISSYIGHVDRVVRPILVTADRTRAELIVLAGAEIKTRALADSLAPMLPVGCRIAQVNDAIDADDLAEKTVRLVSDATARATVDHLQDQRFLIGHNGAVDGVPDTIQALSAAIVDRLLIHDDPADRRRLWIGSDKTALSLTEVENWQDARLIDATIRSAILQDVPVRIIPPTGKTGPDDDTAALTLSRVEPMLAAADEVA